MKPLLKRGLPDTEFAWDWPVRLNLYDIIFEGKAADQLSIIDHSSHCPQQVPFGMLRRMSDRLAQNLIERGVRQVDRVGVLRGQGPWCAAAHLAIWKIGAISVPLFRLFRHDALKSRLHDADCRLVVCDTDTEGMIKRLAAPLVPERDLPPGSQRSNRFLPDMGANTGPEDPAVLIYTSGTTGSPKGALHGHRVLHGHLPGVEMSHDFLGHPRDVLYTPADWAWIGGLFDVLMPGLALGVPVVAGPSRVFDPGHCARLMQETGVRCAFLPPTALRMMRAAGQQASGLRSVASGGEPLGSGMHTWGREALGVTINEFYGQTECNMIVSSCSTAFANRPGCVGRVVPGHEVRVIDMDGAPASGEGDIAVRTGSGSMMLGYWKRPAETAAAFRDEWLITGDRGIMEDGYLRFVGRVDDVITTAGYRVGPAEVEDCLTTHPDVALAAVVAKPDQIRGSRIKAYVVARPGCSLTSERLQEWVKERLAAHCYPREVEVVGSLPLTVTGKVIRAELRSRAVAEAAAS